MHPFDPVRSLADVRHEFGEHGGVNMSIEASTTFTVMQARTMPELFAGRRGPEDGGCYLYGRHFNPTVYAFSRQLAALEGTEAAYCTASGMAAVAASILQLCDAGDHIVASHTLYGGTFALFAEFLPRKCGVTTTFVDACNPQAVRAAITDRTRLVYVESLSNPTLQVCDIPMVAAITRAAGIKLVVDNTFSPVVVSPAQLGADIVVHSLTKFISGASDVIAGAICADEAFVAQLMDLHTGSLMLLGPTMDPRIAFQLSQRMPHLALRVAEHCRRAQVFAERLTDLGIDVIYPGLPGHSGYETLARIRNPGRGSGGLLGIDIGDGARADQLMEALQNKDRFGFMAVSLGNADTLMSRSAASTSSEMGAEEMERAGIRPGLVRVSIGYTGTLEQRWTQLRDGLRVIGLA